MKGGVAHGATDDIGYYIAEDRTEIRDLHATILHLLGEPVPPVMDGQVLQGIFKEPWEVVMGDVEETAVSDDQNLSDAESAEVEERLRSLGYL